MSKKTLTPFEIALINAVIDSGQEKITVAQAKQIALKQFNIQKQQLSSTVGQLWASGLFIKRLIFLTPSDEALTLFAELNLKVGNSEGQVTNFSYQLDNAVGNSQ